MFRRAVFAIGFFAFCGCTEEGRVFDPPLLIGSGGLAGLVDVVPPALVMGETRMTEMSGRAPFMGFVLGASEGATVRLALEAGDRSARTEIALYGPRDRRGLFGQALSCAAGEGASHLANIRLSGGGDYLVLGRVEGGPQAAFSLSYDCSAGCAPPGCTPRLCGDYCPAGFVYEGPCPTCACAAGCVRDADCALGYRCRDGLCLQADPCACADDRYDPVCGEDGQTYPNACRLACAGVAQGYAGPCRSECAADADCPAGMVCRDGSCRAVCGCETEPFSPVCGADGRTYANLCELRCAGIALAFACRCDAYLPGEICGNGLDDDCDGLADEGCGSSCASDADCAASEFCAGGTCIQGMACAANSDCPVGQVCQAGLCRLPSGCEAEICDGLDNDCDGVVDEGCAACRADGDCAGSERCCSGRCADTARDRQNCGTCGNLCGVQEVCLDGACTGSCECQSDVECDDANPGTIDLCRDCRCSHAPCVDGDGDGYCSGVDCDDADAAVHPGAAETCFDRIDNNCDGTVDEGCATCASDADCAGGLNCCEGLCKDIGSDPEHCGGCGTRCPAGQGCGGGWCAARCSTDSDCPSGQACLEGLCRIYCRLDSDCLAGQACVDNLCVRAP